MARSVFYYHLKRLRAADKYVNEKDNIKAIFHEHKGRYGYRRITAEMRNRGFIINHKTVQRLMQSMNIKSQIRKVRYRSYKGEVGKNRSRISLDRDFAASAPNQQMGDRCDTDKHRFCLSCICLQSWICSTARSYLTTSLEIAKPGADIRYAWTKLLTKYDNLDGLILHSDQGWQYQHYGYRTAS